MLELARNNLELEADLHLFRLLAVPLKLPPTSLALIVLTFVITLTMYLGETSASWNVRNYLLDSTGGDALNGAFFPKSDFTLKTETWI